MLDPFVLLALVLLLPIVALLRFIGCDLYEGGIVGGVAIVTIQPPTADLGPGQSLKFVALVNNVPDTAAKWGGSSNIGYTTGFYLAPDPFFEPTDEVMAYTPSGSATANITLHP